MPARPAASHRLGRTMEAWGQKAMADRCRFGHNILQGKRLRHELPRNAGPGRQRGECTSRTRISLAISDIPCNHAGG